MRCAITELLPLTIQFFGWPQVIARSEIVDECFKIFRLQPYSGLSKMTIYC